MWCRARSGTGFAVWDGVGVHCVLFCTNAVGCGVLACVYAAGALCQRSVPSPESSMALLYSQSLTMCLPYEVACRPLLEVSKHSNGMA